MTKNKYVKTVVSQLFPEELRAIEWSANAVWNAVAQDALLMGSVSRAEVIEIVLDADRLFEELHHNRVFRSSPKLQKMFEGRYADRDLMNWLDHHLKTVVFSYPRYETR